MSKNILLLGFLLPSLTTFAKINISKQYSFAPVALTKIETSLQKAFQRPEEMQKYLVYYSIDKANSISLGCGPHLPDKDGKGCSLNFPIELANNSSLLISKKVSIKDKSKEVETELAKVDPNSTQDHLQFGSIFDPQDTYGSHYFCQPEGVEGKRTWGCYLYVHEALN